MSTIDLTQCTAQCDVGVYLRIKLTPRARKNQILGIISTAQGPALKISLIAPAVEGRANQALIEFLAHIFCVALRSISIERGELSREKKILIHGALIEDLCKKLSMKK